ncbi:MULTISPECIES: hypothetical protein [unclassified Streptomyces]|nr:MULTISPECIES: hypothetical protein [unclassified Streptomyces]
MTPAEVGLAHRALAEQTRQRIAAAKDAAKATDAAARQIAAQQH